MLGVSFLVLPGQWRAWVELLIANQGKGGTWAAIPIPLIVRLPIGVLLIVWGAPRNQRWTVPVGAMLALPALWYGSLSMLLGGDPAHDAGGAVARVGPGPRPVRAVRGGGFVDRRSAGAARPRHAQLGLVVNRVHAFVSRAAHSCTAFSDGASIGRPTRSIWRSA